MKTSYSSRISQLKTGVCAALILAGGQAWALPNAAEVIPAQGGPIRITPIYHASMQIEYGGVVVDVDPFSAGDYTGAKKPDIILITDIHPDHLDQKAIKKLLSPHGYTVIYGPASVTGLLKGFQNSRVRVTTIEGQGFWKFGGSMSSPTVDIAYLPMYNLVRGPKPGEKFHPKGRGNGYVLTMGGKRIYIAGDTEVTPEMKALKNIDVAFLPMNLPFTMTPQEAAAGAKVFKPKIVYPYHYRYPFDKPNNNPQTFASALKGTGITVKIRDWYGHPANG